MDKDQPPVTPADEKSRRSHRIVLVLTLAGFACLIGYGHGFSTAAGPGMGTGETPPGLLMFVGGIFGVALGFSFALRYALGHLGHALGVLLPYAVFLATAMAGGPAAAPLRNGLIGGGIVGLALFVIATLFMVVTDTTDDE